MTERRDIGNKLRILLFWLVLPRQVVVEINFLKGLQGILIFCVCLNLTKKLYQKYSNL
jgi:hypothetical protein